MRHELCLDNRNEPKWRITLSAANRTHACAIVYAAFFREDIGEDGNMREPWPVINAADPVHLLVHQFYEQQRNQAAQLNPGVVNPPGNLWNIAQLDARIFPIQLVYHWDHQAD